MRWKVKDLNFTGARINQNPSRNFETLLPSNENSTVFALFEMGIFCGKIVIVWTDNGKR